MGIYVNPEGMTKEEWLARFGKPITREQAFLSPEHLPVVWVDNGPFTAVGVADTERELAAFLDDPMDHRPKALYLCRREDLRAVVGGLLG